MKKRIASLLTFLAFFGAYFIISCRHEPPITVNGVACDMHLTVSVTSVDSNHRGTIVVHAHNGSGFYFQLEGGTAQSDSSFINLDPGEYHIDVTNGSGCVNSIHVIVDSSNIPNGTGGGGTGGGGTGGGTGGGGTCPTINVSATPTNPTNGANGSISASATGGMAPYTYSINGGAYSSSSSFTGLTAGNYTVSVKDANNCPGTSSQVTLTGGGTCPNIMVSGTPTRTSTICATDASIAASAMGGVAPYTYSKDGTTFQTSATFSTLATGNYTITAKDANGCTGNIQVTVSGPATVSFATDVKPIINSTCGRSQISCHSHSNAWTTYSDIVGTSTGTTWTSNLSTFIGRIRGTSGSANSQCPLTKSSGNHNMPPSSTTTWTNFVKGALTNWIDQGYPNN